LAVYSLAGCSKGSHYEQKEFVVSPEEIIAENVIAEEFIPEEVIQERYCDNLVITEEGIHQYYYQEELICEAYVTEIVVGITSADEIQKELDDLFDVQIDWKLSLKEFAVGTTLILAAGVVGGILGPSTYFVSFSALKALKSAVAGGIINSIINVICNGIKDEGLTGKSFAKYAIEGFSEGYMYAAFSSAAENAAENIVRYIRFNSKYGEYYSIGRDGTIYDLSGKKIGTGYYQNGNISIIEESRKNNGLSAKKSAYPQRAVFETEDGIRCYTDDDGTIYRMDNVRVPNISYRLGNNTYFTDSKGRIRKVQFDLSLKADRQGRLGIIDSMENIGKGDALPGDHRGHLIADQFDGDNSMANIVPMSAKANLTEVKEIESGWKKALQEGKKVFGEIIISYVQDSFRPESFEYIYQIGQGEKIVKTVIN